MAEAGDSGKVRSCIKSVLKQRLEILEKAESSPEAIQEAVGQVRVIDLPFFRKYGHQLTGKTLTIFGCMVLAPAAQPGQPRVHGSLEDASPRKRGTRPVPVRFKSMPEKEAHFLDEKIPCSHWKVTVERRDGKTGLYSEEILGNPLP